MVESTKSQVSFMTDDQTNTAQAQAETQVRRLSKDGSVHVTDEFYNTAISSFGALVSLIGITFLVFKARQLNLYWHAWGFLVYGFGLVLMFLSSALHHGINGSPRTDFHLRQLDYYAIFVMIAGTFTPFCLVLMRNSFGNTILTLVWTLAVLGIFLKIIFPHIHRYYLTGIYIFMGWLGVLLIKPMYEALHIHGLTIFFLGGIFFTVGGAIYALEKPNPFPGRFGFHEIWHCFVFAGAASHFYAIWLLLP